MPVVLITPQALQDPSSSYARRLREAGFEVRYPSNPEVTLGTTGVDEVIAEWRGAHGVLTGGEHCTRQLIDALPDLRVIARVGVGYDRVDVEAATARGVAVTITPNSNHECVAEHALALLFAAARSIAHHDRMMRAGEWPRSNLVPLRGRTLGILGLGRIGRSLAVRARALGMAVLACDELADEEFAAGHDVEIVDLDGLLARSDFVSLHCPLNGATESMFDASLFAKMKPGSIFINTARGGLVVEDDLVAALDSGHIGAAGLDVFVEEPLPAGHALLGIGNVVLAPHLGGADATSIENMGLESADNIIRLHREDWPGGNVVNADLGPAWKW